MPLTKTLPLSSLSIDKWVEGLAAIPATEFSQENVQRYIDQRAILSGSLQPYTFFSPDRYTRNLIFKNEVFECLAMCWNVGQSSSIHNHGDRLGWMYLAIGRLYIQNYCIVARDSSKSTCRLVATDGVELNAEQASDVDREDGVHKVCNLPRFGKPAVSVHVYQRPMDFCEVYSLEKGTYDVVELSYTTQYGCFVPESESKYSLLLSSSCVGEL
jgi:cysteine dioxygenase